MAQIKRAFTIQKLEGTYEQDRTSLVDGKVTQTTEKHDRGWLATFPQGHTLHVTSREELQRLGLDKTSAFIDMESGAQPVLTKQPTSRRRRADTAHVEANIDA